MIGYAFADDTTITESIELKHLDRGTSADTEGDESALCPPGGRESTGATEKEKSNQDNDPHKPWHTLVSYVDELTVGGRRNSKGQYVDGMGNFPYLGKNKAPKVPQDCFPQHCYQRYNTKLFYNSLTPYLSISSIHHQSPMKNYPYLIFLNI